MMYYFSLGMYIRNEFGLWQGDDGLRESAMCPLAAFLVL